jgi:hypothetical protein
MEEDDPERFKEARDGDHLMITFQCDNCVFWLKRNRVAIVGNIYDELTQVCIRRVTLDAFWSRERSTVLANRREGVKQLLACGQISDENPYPARGPWAAVDVFGYNTACAMLIRSLDVGKHAATIQYKTLRKMRSHVSNFMHTTPGGMCASFISDDVSTAAMTHSPTNSPWFKRYM